MAGDVEGATASLGRAKAGYAHHRETILLEALLARAAGDLQAAAALLEKAKEAAGDNWLEIERLFGSALDQS